MDTNGSHTDKFGCGYGCDYGYCDHIKSENSMTLIPLKRSYSNVAELEMDFPKDQLAESNNIVNSSDHTTVSSVIFCQWYNLLWVLRILGSCPLTIEKLSDGKVKVVFKWVSWASLYSFVVDIFRIWMSILYFKNWGYFILGRAYEDKLEDHIFKMMNYTMPLYQWWEILAAWTMSPKGALLCNSWIDEEEKSAKVFEESYSYNNSIGSWRWRWVVLGVTTASLAGMSGCFIIEFVYSEPSVDFELTRLIRIFPMTFFILVNVMEEVRVLLLYFTASEAFDFIGNGILSQITETERIPHQLVSKWRIILQGTRKNVKLTGSIQAPQQIASLLHSILIFTGILFIMTQSLLTGHFTKTLLVSLLIGNSFLMRTMMKIIMAECIITKEQRIADILLGINSELLDLKGELEVCKIINIIHQKPSKISLAGYVTMEKKLIPKLVTHVVSHLVILIQFHLGYYVNGRVTCPNV